MEIKIIGDPILEASVNLRNFRKIIQKEYDMEKAVKSSLTIRKNLFPKERMDIHKDTINLKLYPVEYKDWVRYKPDKVDMKNQVFKFREIRGDGKGAMIYQDFVENISWNVKNFIDNLAFQFGEGDFNILIDVENVA